MYLGPFDVVLSDTDVVEPDLLFISRAREHTITEENVRGAPDLVIEILSPSTADRDLGYKHDLYGRHGVLKYWIVDPMAEVLAVHRQRDGRLGRAETFGRRDTLRTALLKRAAAQARRCLCELSNPDALGDEGPSGRRSTQSDDVDN